MIARLVSKAGESGWRKVGEKAVITAVTTLLSETIKASIELVKKAKLREQKADFDDRRARDKKEDEPDETQTSEPDEERDDDSDEDVEDENDAAESDRPNLDFESFIASKRKMSKG
jgi:recombinational DNA repair protein RecT